VSSHRWRFPRTRCHRGLRRRARSGPEVGPLPSCRRKEIRKGEVRTFPRACSRPAVTSTVAHPRRSVKEPERARSPQRTIRPSRRSGSTIRTRPRAQLLRAALVRRSYRGARRPGRRRSLRRGAAVLSCRRGENTANSGPGHSRGFEPAPACPSAPVPNPCPTSEKGPPPTSALSRTADTGLADVPCPHRWSSSPSRGCPTSVASRERVAVPPDGDMRRFLLQRREVGPMEPLRPEAELASSPIPGQGLQGESGLDRPPTLWAASPLFVVDRPSDWPTSWCSLGYHRLSRERDPYRSPLRAHFRMGASRSRARCHSGGRVARTG